MEKLIRFLSAMMVAVFLTSCATGGFYQTVKPGQLLGSPRVEWEGPNRFVLHSDKGAPFSFVRHNGDVIIPQALKTDGGSLPRWLWGYDGFSPWQYAPAYLIHDWLYEAHCELLHPGDVRSGVYRFNRSKEPMTREEADLIMAEVIKTQMTDPRFKTKESVWHLEKIHWAVRKYGQRAWEGKPDPVPPGEFGPTLVPTDFLPVRWPQPLGMGVQRVLRGIGSAIPKLPQRKTTPEGETQPSAAPKPTTPRAAAPAAPAAKR